MHVSSHLQEKAAKVAEVLSGGAHFSRELTLLYASRMLQRISLSALGVFLPIYFYEIFNGDLATVIAIFIAIYGGYLVTIPIGARLLSIWGTRLMMIVATAMAFLATAALYFVPEYPALAIFGYMLFITAFRSLYWVPYYVDLSLSLDTRHRGSQLAFLLNVSAFTLALVPMLGGFMIANYGYGTVFFFAMIVLMFAMWPLLYVSTTIERYSWGYIDSFFHLFKRENRRLLLAHAANGAQGTALLIFWPIYLFLLFNEQYTVLGIISTLTILVLMFLRYVTGRLFDRWGKEKILAIGTAVAASGWGLKLFVQAPIEVLVVDTYHNLGQTMNTVSFDAATYEQAADNGRFVDEYSALKEMALTLGRVVMLLVVGALLAFFDIRIAFVLAAVMTLAMILLNKKMQVQ